jgi:hypothetical protein
MKKEGEIIQKFDVKPAIQIHAETADWPYREEAKFWYGVAKEMDKRFFNGLVYPDGRKVPAPAITFDDLGNIKTVATYSLYPDEYGILGKITFNTAYYAQTNDEGLYWMRGRYSQGETLLHEYIHLWQQIGRGKDPYTPSEHRRNTHNKEFIAFAEQLGIHPLPVKGIHTKIATPDSPIDILLKDMGIFPPKKAYEKPEGDMRSWAEWVIEARGGRLKKEGTSTLHKWECPDCGLKVRIGIGADPYLVHDVCSEIKGEKVFLVRADGRQHSIYKAR